MISTRPPSASVRPNAHAAIHRTAGRTMSAWPSPSMDHRARGTRRVRRVLGRTANDKARLCPATAAFIVATRVRSREVILRAPTGAPSTMRQSHHRPGRRPRTALRPDHRGSLRVRIQHNNDLLCAWRGPSAGIAAPFRRRWEAVRLDLGHSPSGRETPAEHAVARVRPSNDGAVGAGPHRRWRRGRPPQQHVASRMRITA